MLFPRLLNLPPNPSRSLFLWGPRQTGKSTLLKQHYSDALRIDLLKSDEFSRFAESPATLRAIAAANSNRLIIIDEVQKLPQLLDEVHWSIENLGTRFVLCGSSARKLKRGGANLLGGRARRYELHGLVSKEIGKDFDIIRLTNFGNLPIHYLSDDAEKDLEAYVGDYLKEEIAAEALVRKLPKFIDFLRAAAIGDTEICDYTKIGSECGASSATTRNYYSILEDTLLGFFLPAYTAKQKRRVIHAPKFYFANVGVVNHLAKRHQLEVGSELFGKAYENWLMHELRTYSSYSQQGWNLSYWRLSSGGEVDLIVNDCEHAFEFKSSARLTNAHLRGLRELRNDNRKIKTLTLVNLQEHASQTEDKIDVLPVKEFLQRLWADSWK